MQGQQQQQHQSQQQQQQQPGTVPGGLTPQQQQAYLQAQYAQQRALYGQQIAAGGVVPPGVGPQSQRTVGTVPQQQPNPNPFAQQANPQQRADSPNRRGSDLSPRNPDANPFAAAAAPVDTGGRGGPKDLVKSRSFSSLPSNYGFPSPPASPPAMPLDLAGGSTITPVPGGGSTSSGLYTGSNVVGQGQQPPYTTPGLANQNITPGGGFSPSAAQGVTGGVTSGVGVTGVTPVTLPSDRQGNLEVRVLNGVSGTEVTRFSMPTNTSNSEQHFFQLLDGMTQQRAGYSLHQLHWVGRKRKTYYSFHKIIFISSFCTFIVNR